MKPRIGTISGDSLWVGLQAHLRDTKGYVGLMKLLGQRSETEAGAAWIASVRPVVDAMASATTVSVDGPARLDLGDGVKVQLDLHECIILVDDQARWVSLLRNDPAALAVAALARQRWGRDWVRALGEPHSRPVVRRSPGSFDDDVYPWVAQNPGGPAPYTSAASETDARLAAAAEERGSVEVQRLFAEFERERS